MLSSAAEHMYWLGRYVERAENIARFIGVNQHLNLDLPIRTAGDNSIDMGNQWLPMVQVTGDYKTFTERHTAAGREEVIDFLIFDRDYPNSILSCLNMARENARALRPIISTEMWEAINTFYLMVSGAPRAHVLQTPSRFLEDVKTASQRFIGIKEATMSHGEAWHFSRMGRLLERADKTSRILDVKYFILLPRIQDVGTPFDNVQWAALLRSASALEMYRRDYGRIMPKSVVEFLVLDRHFPRSMYFCLLEAGQSLRAITGSQEGAFSNDAEQCLGRLQADIAYSDVEGIIGEGLHEYLDRFQTRLNETDTAMQQTFFALGPA